MTQSEILATQMGTDEIQTELSQVNEQFGDSPIWVRGNFETGYFATMGDHKISKQYESLEELKRNVENKDWEIVLNIIALMVSIVNTVNNTNK